MGPMRPPVGSPVDRATHLGGGGAWGEPAWHVCCAKPEGPPQRADPYHPLLPEGALTVPLLTTAFMKTYFKSLAREHTPSINRMPTYAGGGGVWNAQACGPEMFFKDDRAIRGSSKWSRGPQGRLLGGSSFDQDPAMDQVHCAWLPLL